MNKAIKLLLLAAVAGSMFLTACAPPPPAVSEDALNQAYTETEQAEAEAAELLKQKTDLENQLQTKRTELEKLEAYERQLKGE